MRKLWILMLALQPVTGCFTCGCEPGFLPIDGSTAVAPDVAIEVRGEQLDPELIALGGIVFEGRDGPIPHRVDWDGEVARVVPDAPLALGSYTVAVGFRADLDEATSGHFARPLAEQVHRGGRMDFTVGSAPRALWAFRDGGELYLRFSEPVVFQTLAFAVAVEGRPLIPERVDGRLVRLPDVPETAVAVELLEGIEARSGQSVPAGVVGIDPSWDLERLRGVQRCSC